VKSKFGVFILVLSLLLVTFAFGCSSTNAATHSTPPVTPSTTLVTTSAPPTTTVATSSVPVVSTTATTVPPISTTTTTVPPVTTTTTTVPPVTTSTPPATTTTVDTTPPVFEQKYKITIGGGTFNPSNITIAVGTDVEFENLDHMDNNLISDYPFDIILGSETITPFIFDKAGTFTFWTVANPSVKGTIIVK
jgi:plastocyanin